MGFLDIFKKKVNTKPNVENVPQAQRLPFEVKFLQTSDGRLQVDFHDKNADFKQFYNSTRLIVNPRPLNMANEAVYNCMVSWYNEDDCIMIDRETGKEISSRTNYRGVLAQIDLYLLQRDPNYCQMVMQGLLDKKRVEKYLVAGLEETPDIPCGKYIGGVAQKENGYGKIFSRNVGIASHNSELMVNRRQQHREMSEQRRQQQIADRRAQIARLQSEIDDLGR